MSSDRSDGGEPGRAAQGASSTDDAPKPVERSPRGRIIIRSSSHPPGAESSASDAREYSGAHVLPVLSPEFGEGSGAESDERAGTRSKRTTPAERPRRRRQIQAALEERARQDTPAARPVARKRRRGVDPLAAAPNPVATHSANALLNAAPTFAAPVTSAQLASDFAKEAKAIRRASGWRDLAYVAVALIAVAILWLILRG